MSGAGTDVARRDTHGDIPRIAGQGNGGQCRPERGARSVGDVTTQAVRRETSSSVL